MCASQNTCPPSWYGVWLHGHWGQVQWGHWTCSWEHRENKLQLVYVLHMLRGPTEVYCWDTRPRGSRPHHASCSEEPREPCLVRHIRPAEVSSSGFPCWATVCLSLFLTQLLTFTYWLVFYRVAFQLDIIIWQEELNVSVFGIFAKTLLNPAIWKCSCAQKVVGHRIFGVQTSRQGRRTCASISSSRTTCCLLLLVYAYKPHTLKEWDIPDFSPNWCCYFVNGCQCQSVINANQLSSERVSWVCKPFCIPKKTKLTPGPFCNEGIKLRASGIPSNRSTAELHPKPVCNWELEVHS